MQGVPNEAQPVIGICYKGEPLEKKYQPDFVCYGEVIVEIKAIAGLSGFEESQIINYLKATGLRVGLLINFGGKSLEYRRFVYDPIHRLHRWTQIRENESGDHMEGVGEVQAPYDSQMTEIDPNLGPGKASVKSVKSVDGMPWTMWSRMEVSTVERKETFLRFKRPLYLDIAFDEKEREFVVEFPELNIFLSACTPEELYRAFCDDIVWLWEEYGKCDDKNLSEDGIRLKNEILDLVESDVVP